MTDFVAYNNLYIYPENYRGISVALKSVYKVERWIYFEFLIKNENKAFFEFSVETGDSHANTSKLEFQPELSWTKLIGFSSIGGVSNPIIFDRSLACMCMTIETEEELERITLWPKLKSPFSDEVHIYFSPIDISLDDEEGIATATSHSEEEKGQISLQLMEDGLSDIYNIDGIVISTPAYYWDFENCWDDDAPILIAVSNEGETESFAFYIYNGSQKNISVSFDLISIDGESETLESPVLFLDKGSDDTLIFTLLRNL